MSLREGLSSAAAASDSSLAPFFTPADRHAGAPAMQSAAISLGSEHATASASDAAQCGQYATLARAQPEAQRAVDIAASATTSAAPATNGEPGDGSGSADGPRAAASHTSPAATGSATTHTYATATTATTAQVVVATVQTDQAQVIGTQADGAECAQPQCIAPTAAEPPAAAFTSPSNAATPTRSRAKASFAAESSQTADRARSAPAFSRVSNAISGTSRCPSPGGKSAVAAYVAEHGAAITRASAPAWLYDDASDVAGRPPATSLVGLPLIRAGSSGAARAVLATAQRRTQSASPRRGSHERAHELDCFGAGLIVSCDASPASSPRATQSPKIASHTEPVSSPRSPARLNTDDVSSSVRRQQPRPVSASRDAGTAAGKQHDATPLISLDAAASTPAHIATADGQLSAAPSLMDSPCSSPTAFAKYEAHSAVSAVPAPAAAQQDTDAGNGASAGAGSTATKRALDLGSLQEVPVDTSDSVVARGCGDVNWSAGETAHGASGINSEHVATGYTGSEPVDALRSLQEVSVDVDGCGGSTSASSPSSVREAAAAAATAALERREDACLSASALPMSELHAEGDIAQAAVNAGSIESSATTDAAPPESTVEAQQRCTRAQPHEQQGDSRTMSRSGTAAVLAPPQGHTSGADGVTQVQALSVQHGATPLQRSASLAAKLVASESVEAVEANSSAKTEQHAHNATEMQHRDQATATPHHVAVQTDADAGAATAPASVQAGNRQPADVAPEHPPVPCSDNICLATSEAEQKEEPAAPNPAVSAAARAITAELDRLLSALRRERAPALQLRSVPRPLSAPPATPLDALEATTLVDQSKPHALAPAVRSSSAQPAPRQQARARLALAGTRNSAVAGTDSPSCLQFTYSRSPGGESVDFTVDGKCVLPCEEVSGAAPAHDDGAPAPLLSAVNERKAPGPGEHPDADPELPDADQSGPPTAPRVHKATATPHPSSAAAGTQTPVQPATTAHSATSSLTRPQPKASEHQQCPTPRAASPAPAIAPATAASATADCRPLSPLRTTSAPVSPTAPALADPHVVGATRGITASTQTPALQPAAQSEARSAAAVHATTDQPVPAVAPSSQLSSPQRTSPTRAPSADALHKAVARYPTLFPSLSLPAVRTPATAPPGPPAQANIAPKTSASPVASSCAASPLGRGDGYTRSASAAPRYSPAWGSALVPGFPTPATGAVPVPASAGVDNEVGAAASAVLADVAEADDKANNGEGVISITGYNFASIQMSCATRARVSTKRGAGHVSITEDGEAPAPETRAATPPAATCLAVDASLQGWHSSADRAGLELTSYSQAVGAENAAPFDQVSHAIPSMQQAHAQPVRGSLSSLSFDLLCLCITQVSRAGLPETQYLRCRDAVNRRRY